VLQLETKFAACKHKKQCKIVIAPLTPYFNIYVNFISLCKLYPYIYFVFYTVF